jgi:hypothetical protein
MRNILLMDFKGGSEASFTRRLKVCWWIVRYGGYIAFRDLNTGNVDLAPLTKGNREKVQIMASGKAPLAPAAIARA